MHWTRAQFEPGRPDPHPPPIAATILAEIRAGRTGGFCAQYAFVLVQAIQSFGMPARVVTIRNHEVVEIRDARSPHLELAVTPESLATTHVSGLYAAPSDFPYERTPESAQAAQSGPGAGSVVRGL